MKPEKRKFKVGDKFYRPQYNDFCKIISIDNEDSLLRYEVRCHIWSWWVTTAQVLMSWWVTTAQVLSWVFVETPIQRMKRLYGED